MQGCPLFLSYKGEGRVRLRLYQPLEGVKESGCIWTSAELKRKSHHSIVEIEIVATFLPCLLLLITIHRFIGGNASPWGMYALRRSNACLCSPDATGLISICTLQYVPVRPCSMSHCYRRFLKCNALLSLVDEVMRVTFGMKDAVMRLCFRKAREECGLVTVP